MIMCMNYSLSNEAFFTWNGTILCMKVLEEKHCVYMMANSIVDKLFSEADLIFDAGSP